MIQGAWVVTALTLGNLNPAHMYAWRRAEDVLRFWGLW